MKLHSPYKAILLSALATLAVGCSHQQIPIKKVFSSNNCGITKPALKSIATPIELDDLFQSIPKTFSQRTLLVPEVDFEKDNLILYALGQQPTSGYSIKLTKSEAQLTDKILSLPIRVQKPNPDFNHAQVITSPCSLYSLPKHEYKKVVLQDTQ